jgi:hypothetical protein
VETEKQAHDGARERLLAGHIAMTEESAGQGEA